MEYAVNKHQHVDWVALDHLLAPPIHVLKDTEPLYEMAE